MTALVEIWGASFAVGFGLTFLAMTLSYPFQVFKQGIDQV